MRNFFEKKSCKNRLGVERKLMLIKYIKLMLIKLQNVIIRFRLKAFFFDHKPGNNEPLSQIYGFNQGWWSRLNFNGSSSGARFSKLLSSDSGSGAGHFSFMSPTPAPFDLNFASSGSAPN